MTWRTAWPAAAGLGVVCALGFDPVALPFAMIVGVAGLIWLAHRMEGQRKRTVAVAGLIFGAAFMGPLIWWMNAVSSGAYVALVILELLYFAPIMLALRATGRLPGWPLWGAAVWVAGEYAREIFPFTGFPWGRLAHTSIDTPFSSYARLVSMPGTSFVLFVVAAMLVVVVTSDTWRRRGVAALVIVGLAGVGALLPTGVADPDGERRIALVQGNTPTPFPPWPRGELFQKHVTETRVLADRIASGDEPQPDMVLWPETATDVDPFANPSAAATIDLLVAELGAPLLIGGLFDGPTPDTALNAGLVWTEDGPGERYVKRRPVPYGEYVPFRRQLGPIVPQVSREIPRDMLPGDEVGTLPIGGAVIGDTICWDIAYDGIVRDAVNDGAQVLVVQTSNASFTGTSQPDQQWKISRLRAIETGRWVVVPSTNGISGIVDADGEVVSIAEREEPATLSADVPLAQGRTPASVIGGPVQALLVLLGVVGWVLGIRRGRA